MDSLTQIVLGAACGELVLGKKIGNKALLFGAIGGTIPDLDVFIGKLLYTNTIDAMAFHRGFMHSITFAFISAFLLGKLSYTLYNTGKRKDTTSLKNWILLFFTAIITHPILDSFTPYGTQLFLPFSNYRLAFNTISVVDPLYTLPFLLPLLIAMFFNRKSNTRKKWTYLGITISSLYMLFTIFNKLYINSIFRNSFKKAGITYKNYTVQPTFFNNILWYGVAETANNYKIGFYSLLDTKTTVDTILTIPKNRELLPIEHPDIKTLRWFSNEFYTLQKTEDSNNIAYIDLRYPLLNPKNPNTAVFQFELKKNENRWSIISSSKKRPSKKDLEVFVKRIYGR